MENLTNSLANAKLNNSSFFENKPLIAPIQKDIKINSTNHRGYLRGCIQVVTNFYSFNFDTIKIDEIFLYAIQVQDYRGIENAHYGLIKRLSRSNNFKTLMNTFFADYWITGNSIFAEPLEITESYKLAILFVDNKDTIIDILEIEKYPQENVYILTITKKYNIKDFQQETNFQDKDHIKRFMNCIIARGLVKNNYKKTDSSPRSLYYKMDPKEYIQTHGSSIYFVSGIKINTNFYDRKFMLCKAVQKFRMLRKETYYDLWNHCKNNFGNNCNKMFSEYTFGKEGLTLYSDRNIKIDDVDYKLSPATYFIETSSGSKISLMQYYYEKYKIQINDENQPLLVNKKIRKMKDKSQIIEIIYFVPELLCIMGKLPFDNVNFAQYTLLKPDEKFSRTNNIMKIIQEYQNRLFKDKISNNTTTTTKLSVDKEKITDKNFNFEIKKMKTFVLKNPLIIVDKNKLVPDDTGKFDMKNQAPLENKSLKNWIIFLFDADENEWNLILDKMEKSVNGLNLKIENQPELRVINIYSRSRQEKVEKLEEYFDNAFEEFYNIQEERKKKEKDFKYEFIIYILSNREKETYINFKECLNRSNLKIPSQVFKKENVLKKDLSVISNIFLQIWAKRDLRTWRTETIKEECLKDVMICSYSIARSTLTGQSITSICGSYNKDFSQYFYFSEFHEYSGKISIVIVGLFEKILREYKKMKDNYPKKIIIYREGVNYAQRKLVHEKEFNLIQQLMSKEPFKGITFTFIFVNSHCDTKIYREISTKTDREGLEIFDLSIDSYNNNYLGNVLPGTIIDNTITSESEWDFYLTSTVSIQGTSNSTHYVVYYDDNQIPPIVLYKLTYDLTFLYYNNQKCVRLPAPLKNCINRSNHIAKYIRTPISSKMRYHNFTL